VSVKFAQGREVVRPTTTPLKSSVLDHATVVTESSFGLRNNMGLWPSYACLDMTVPTALCADPGSVKTFGFAPWVPAVEGAVMGGVQCSNVGLDRDDMKAEVARVFALAEGKGVEQLLLYNRFVERANGSDEVGPEWDAPTDLTPSSDVSLMVALALLEGHAAANYAGVPTIHMPRAAATMLEGNGLIVWEGDLAYTKNKSKVAMGGGYDDEDMLASGAWTMYATGAVYVERAEDIGVHDYPILPGFVTAQAAEDGYDANTDPNLFTDNTLLVLAERMFRVAVDCFTAQATGTVF
jgi:hypothetical protein